jgi:hypothetical protein
MATIQRINDPSRVRRIWQSIFTSNDPFSFPFQPQIGASLIFYPTDGYHLTEEQYGAISDAARAIGEEGFVVSVVEYEVDFLERGESWWCAFPEYEDYLSLPLVLHNSLFSMNSRWGLLVSHEDHAIVGGSIEFISKIREDYPEFASDIASLRDFWKDKSENEWLNGVLGHLQS